MNPEQKTMEHAAAMSQSRTGTSGHPRGYYQPSPNHGVVALPPWQSHLDTLVAFFAARWPEQVHFRAAWVASPRWSGKAYADYEALEAAMQEEIAKLDPAYQREGCLPRVPRLTAQTWIWGKEISEVELEDHGVGIALWHSVAALALCLHAQKRAASWTSPWDKPRLYWRRLPEIRTESLTDIGMHRVYLRFRCALEGCEAPGTPEGAMAFFI